MDQVHFLQEEKREAKYLADQRTTDRICILRKPFKFLLVMGCIYYDL